MRIFIHNVDTYLGKILVNEVRKAEGGQSHRVFGSVAKSADEAPTIVKRICSKDDPKKVKRMIETLRSCKVVVFDLFSSTLDDLNFVIKALKSDPNNPLETEVTFIMVSSVMVWANTKIDREDGILKDSDHVQRLPAIGSKYEQWKEMEDLAFSTFNKEGSMVKAFVVAGGALYGEGEDVFTPLFKSAWTGDKDEQSHIIIGPGNNHVPTVHVRDLARLVRAVADKSGELSIEQPYFLAVDQHKQEAEQEKIVPPTQAEIVQSVTDEFSCESFEIPQLDEIPVQEEGEEDEAKSTMHQTMMLDLNMQPSDLMLDPEFAALNDPPGWHCREGLAYNIRKVAEEFCKERKLRAMRVLIAGPPASGKSTLCKAVSEHFRIPHHELPAEMGDDEYENMKKLLLERVCRYRGYVLDAGTVGFDAVDRLYRYELNPDVPNEGGENDEEKEDDEEEQGEGEKVINKEKGIDEEIIPSFVVVTQAPEGMLKGLHLQSHGQHTATMFSERLEEYKTLNDPFSLTNFFQDLKIGVLNLPIPGKDEEELFESVRIYMESKGRPFNYLPTEEEVVTEIVARRAAKEAAEAEEKAREAAKLNETGSTVMEGEGKKHELRMRYVSEHEAQQRRLRDMPLREYLMENIIPSLTEGLIEVCKVLPEDPADYLANYLEEHASADIGALPPESPTGAATGTVDR